MEDAYTASWKGRLEAESDLRSRWERLTAWLGRQFGRKADLDGILFLIGVQETGRGYVPDMEKRSKERLVMEGTYCAFESLGLYTRVGMEADGHWIWERTQPAPTGLSAEEQESLLQLAVLSYFLNHLGPQFDEC